MSIRLERAPTWGPSLSEPSIKLAPMSWGQYIHFSSGAARTETKTIATYAFGWNDTWEAQYQKAKTDFPAIKY